MLTDGLHESLSFHAKTEDMEEPKIETSEEQEVEETMIDIGKDISEKQAMEEPIMDISKDHAADASVDLEVHRAEHTVACSGITESNERAVEKEEEGTEDADSLFPKLRPKRIARLKRNKKDKDSLDICANAAEITENLRLMRKKREDLTLAAKVKVLEMMERSPKIPQGKIAYQFHVSQSQISRIIKNKEAIMTQWSHFAVPERKRCRVGKAGELEQKLLEWYKEARKDDLPITGPILMEQAKSIGFDMGIDFKPSAGWLGRWKVRNGVSLKVFKEKDGTTSVTKVANHWRRYMYVKATKDVPWQNVWVLDETVLVYNAVPDCMTQLKEGGDDKMSIILACNLCGTERKAPATVGPVQSLESLSLPVSYYYHEKSKINTECFSTWLREWDRELHSKKKNIVLILSRAKYHPENMHFFNISITYFPANTSKVLQPLQLGIISSFKALYRHQQLKHLLAEILATDSTTHANTSSNNVLISPQSQGLAALDAVYMIYQAWKHVSPETIAKGALKAGLSRDVDSLKVNDCVAAPPGISQQDFMAFVMKDNDIVSETLEDSGGSEAQGRLHSEPCNSVNLKQLHCKQCLSGLPKVSEALSACQVLKRYLQQQGGHLYDEFSKLESALQMDMINQIFPEMRHEDRRDPLHDARSVHSLQAHKGSERLKTEYLQKLHDTQEQKTLQKELKKASGALSASVPPESSHTLDHTQELGSKIVNHAANAESNNLTVLEFPRHDSQPPIQRPPLIQQDMMRPEFQQNLHFDKPRPSGFETRPVNVPTLYKAVQPCTRPCQNEAKNNIIACMPADLRAAPMADPLGVITSHPAKELSQSIQHQPDTRVEQPGVPYYGIQYTLNQCACGSAECCS